jgi:membrane protein YdbS with pleckstrin-like domain
MNFEWWQIVLGIVLLLIIIIFISMVPELRRYFRMRRM